MGVFVQGYAKATLCLHQLTFSRVTHLTGPAGALNATMTQLRGTASIAPKVRRLQMA